MNDNDDFVRFLQGMNGNGADMTQHGSARWMTPHELQESGLLNADGIFLGVDTLDGEEWEAITYTGEQHLFTTAPNRTGKGTCAIIPNLLSYRGGVFCIDPKGENAIVTASTRRRMGQNVQILDPWGIAVDRLRDECGFDGSDPDRAPFQAAGFNPLDAIPADSPNLSDDCALIADANIMTEQGGDSHWSTEAKAAFGGFVGHVVTDPEEEGQRHLPRVRDILSLPPAELLDVIERMAKSPHPFVRGSANRMMQKTEKELQSVMSTASANTHYLDSPAIRETLMQSSFDFGQLKDSENPLSVYLVLPADRLNTHGRWLRLLVSVALTAVSRRKGKPKNSALFILDEFAALGRLAMVEQAFGLMAGFGMRIWAILQDLSQLQDLYGKRWSTFIANSGVLQVFGTNDMLTAEYVSRLLGRGTHERASQYTKEWRENGDPDGGWFRNKTPAPHYSSMGDSTYGRELMTPDEVRRMKNDKQIVLISGKYPLFIEKVPYYSNGRFYIWGPDTNYAGFVPLYCNHPDFPFDYENPPNIGCFDNETRERRDYYKREYTAMLAREKADKENYQSTPKRKKLFGLF